MSVVVPSDKRCTEHVFCLHQLMAMLHAAGHIRVPPGTRVLGAEVDKFGNLTVGFEYGDAYHGPNARPLVIRHDFAEELKLQEQIAQDAQAAKCRLMQNLGDDLQSVKPNLEVAGPAPELEIADLDKTEEVPLAEAVPPTPAEINQHIVDRVKDLYPKAHAKKQHTPYALVFQGTPLERDSTDVVVPFIPGEDVFNILNRFKKLAYDREMSLKYYEFLNGIIQRVHGEGALSSAEKAKAYLREQNYPIELPTEGAAKAA